jgi:tetrahydromethanopterin S-methyltransferase subunit E
MAGALAVMNFCIFVVSSFDVIITAVFPMSLLAIHIGATLGVAQAKEVEVAANTTFAEQHNQTILMEGVYGCRP